MAATWVSLLLFSVLGLFVGPSFGLLDSKLPDPLLFRHGGQERSTELAADPYNTTELELGARSLTKRDYLAQCNNPLLVEGFRQTEAILRDTLIALDLILNLYDGRTGREFLFKPSKMAATGRTSDENLAMAMFVAYFDEFYMGESAPGVAHADNQRGKGRVQMMRDRTNDILNNVQAYNRGIRTTPRGTYGDVYLYCNEDFWRTVDASGRTYVQAHPNSPEPDPLGRRHLWATMGGQAYWYALSHRCSTTPAGGTRDNIRMNPNLYAFVTRNVGGGAPYELMVFCPYHFDPGQQWDVASRNQYPLSALRKNPGQTAPTALQQQFVGQAARRDRSIRHFNQFLSTYIIHESTHARKIVGDQRATTDVPCNGNTPGWGAGRDTNTLTPSCLAHLARLRNDDSSERDAHTYAVYASATYASAIDWTQFEGAARATW
ncbi:hypothetical protein QBC34DRAFT_103544 [Podospora aff. communis PSN243]|uniref:Lysine-specific metallo-endopeptidase domain-containing protein n=1 Tax=Podospora aff. communis PSN243 TaxID=3040156 RepID=A0AAV9H3U9_9PEZI|nr:hypothetical protein QBC34DRAFT_103544 [Podospora aff. communis PSN243]